jgi:adenylate cyclase
MMSDLRGFTAISERMDPGDLIAMLNHYLEVMTGIIQDHKGTIIEFIGDGILAIFGAPVQTETHASDAVAAALGMQQAMDQVNRWNTERDYPILEMGIGINTGEVIVGNLGSEKRMKYGVAGKHVNICGRIESYTVGGQILISPDTRNAIEADLTITSEMTVLPKGAVEELVLSHVTGIGDPYNIHIESKKDVPKALKEPIPICFHKISEKHTMDKPYYGGITALGHDSAILETETSLQLFENIEMKVSGQLFCKVMEKRDSSYLMYYTSIPSGFDLWFRSVLEEDA